MDSSLHCDHSRISEIDMVYTQVTEGFLFLRLFMFDSSDVPTNRILTSRNYFRFIKKKCVFKNLTA